MSIDAQQLPEATFGHISPTEEKILAILVEHHPRGISSESFHTKMRRCSKDHSMKTILSRFRRKLRPFGWDISCALSPPTRNVYRLQPFVEKTKK